MMENDCKLSYSPLLNRFLDEDWVVVHNVNRLFDTWVLDQWVANAVSSVLISKDGLHVYMDYLTPEEDDDVLAFLNYQDLSGVKTDRPHY